MRSHIALMEKRPRPPGQSPNAEYPELPFDKDWSDLVRVTRKSKGISQDDLAAQADTTHATISFIESYEVQQSRAVVPIARALGIELPRGFAEDDKEMLWRVLGGDLRREDPGAFDNALRLVEAM